jgi:hypothetical protein
MGMEGMPVKITAATLTLEVSGDQKLSRLARRKATARVHRTSHGLVRDCTEVARY